MNEKRLTGLRNVALGLLLGVCLTLAVGQAAAPPAPARYQITAFRGTDGNLEFIVLDHRTNKIYHEVEGPVADGTTVESLLR